MANVRWLRLDCSTLKQQLVTLCDSWASAFSTLLSTLAARQLSEIRQELDLATASLTGQQQAQLPTSEDAEEMGGGGDEPEAARQKKLEGSRTELRMTAEQRQAAVEELEALHGRLEGEREEVQQRIEACREKYDALVSLQARCCCGFPVCACGGPSLSLLLLPPASVMLAERVRGGGGALNLHAWYSCLPCCCRWECRRKNLRGWTACPICGTSLWQP